MEIYAFTLVLLCTISSSMAAMALGPAQTHESNPNMCHEEGNYYHPGESWQIQGCGIANCLLSNHTGTPQLFVSYASCGVVAADPPCNITEDTTLAYPECCPKVVCPEEEEAVVEASGENQGSEEELENGVRRMSSVANSDENIGSSIQVDRDSDNEIDDTVVSSKYQYNYDYYNPEDHFSTFYPRDVEALEAYDDQYDVIRHISPKFNFNIRSGSYRLFR